MASLLPQSKQSSSYSDRDTTEEESESLDDMDFLTRQKKLQAEAKMALAMAKPMAKMQVEVEKQNRKKSPVADLVSGAGGEARGDSSPGTSTPLVALAHREGRHGEERWGRDWPQELEGVMGAGWVQGMSWSVRVGAALRLLIL